MKINRLGAVCRLAYRGVDVLLDNLTFQNLLLAWALVMTVVQLNYPGFNLPLSVLVLVFLATVSLLKSDFMHSRTSEQFREAIEIENEFVSK